LVVVVVVVQGLPQRLLVVEEVVEALRYQHPQQLTSQQLLAGVVDRVYQQHQQLMEHLQQPITFKQVLVVAVVSIVQQRLVVLAVLAAGPAVAAVAVVHLTTALPAGQAGQVPTVSQSSSHTSKTYALYRPYRPHLDSRRRSPLHHLRGRPLRFRQRRDDR
jgi:hypothetical protein